MPARAYVFAAGFDSSRNIFLGVKHTSSTGSEAFLLLCFSSFLFRKRREREGDREEGGGGISEVSEIIEDVEDLLRIR